MSPQKVKRHLLKVNHFLAFRRKAKILNFYFQVTCCFLAENLVLVFSEAFFISRAAAESCSGICCCSWEDLFTYVWMTDCEPFSHFKHGFGFFNVQSYAIVIFIEDVLALLIVVERTFTC